jgi:NAD(P)-dependent dehydrogenase (short-subunit alcohol dehydrogenase family)
VTGQAERGIEGTVASVTGAGRGIGREIARVLAELGATVVAASRTAPELDQLAAELVAGGRRVVAHPCDVSQAASARALVGWAREQFGEPSILVCSHGVGAERPFLELTEEQWDETLAINLKGCFLVGQAAATAMVAAGQPGRIVFVSATNALASERRVSDYDASKAGLHGLTRSMALELGPRGITVNAVAPGWIRTPLLEPFLSDELRSGRQVVNPVGRIGRADRHRPDGGVAGASVELVRERRCGGGRRRPVGDAAVALATQAGLTGQPSGLETNRLRPRHRGTNLAASWHLTLLPARSRSGGHHGERRVDDSGTEALRCFRSKHKFDRLLASRTTSIYGGEAGVRVERDPSAAPPDPQSAPVPEPRSGLGD